MPAAAHHPGDEVAAPRPGARRRETRRETAGHRVRRGSGMTTLLADPPSRHNARRDDSREDRDSDRDRSGGGQMVKRMIDLADRLSSIATSGPTESSAGIEGRRDPEPFSRSTRVLSYGLPSSQGAPHDIDALSTRARRGCGVRGRSAGPVASPFAGRAEVELRRREPLLVALPALRRLDFAVLGRRRGDQLAQ